MSDERPDLGARLVELVRADGSQASRVLCSYAVGRHTQLLAESAPTLRAYARRWDWDMALSSESGDLTRPPSWNKIRLARELLERYELVLWIDADAIVVDLDQDIMAGLDDTADVWFAHHFQAHDRAALVANCGVMLLRRSAFSLALLDAIWNAEEYIDHNWWENAALLDLLGYSLEPPFPVVRQTPWQARCGTLDLRWNSVPGYCESPTPAINHHARSDHDDFGLRLRLMQADRVATEHAFPADFKPTALPVAPEAVDGAARRRWWQRGERR